jgi:hypothetical protein
MGKREIGIGTVKVSRNQKNGSFIEVQSKAIERFFALESSNAYVPDCATETVPSHYGFESIYVLPRISDIEQTIGVRLRIDCNPGPDCFSFLRAKGLGDGLKIPLLSPLTVDMAEQLSKRIASAMQTLYISYMRNYAFEVSVRATIEQVDTAEIVGR